MKENDVYSMSVDMAEPNSLVTDGNAYNTNFISASSSDLNVLNNRDQIMCGFPGPSVLQGDSNNLQAFIHGTNSGRISNSYTLENVQPERDSFGDFLYGIPFPINNAPAQGRYMEGMPLSAASLSTLLDARWNPQENLEKFAASSSSAYSLPRNANSIPNSDTLNSSSQITMRYVPDGVSAGTGAKWELNDIFVHPDPAAKALGRAGLQPFESMVNFDPNGWVTSQNTSLSSDSPSGSSRLSNELSLSLATSNPSAVCRASLQDQCSEICCSSRYERCLGSEQTSCSRNLSLNFHSSKPDQLPQLFSSSRYVRAIQEILAEVAFYSLGNLDLTYSATGTDDQANVSFSSCCTAGEGYSLPDSDDFPDADQRATLQIDPSNQSWEVERKKKRLLTLLQVVDDQYNQCLDEIHTVISAFHAVTELNPRIHTRFALQTVSFLYRNLRERISNHILAMGVHFSKGVASNEENSFETSFIQKQWALQQLKRKDNQLWRPQRGLPERSVSVLRAWMFQNFLHPYPKDAEKHLLAVKSGLTRSQVSNWFINARVRLWKPMIEEMYAEMNRRKNRQNDEETNSNQRSRIRIDNQRFAMF